MYKDNICKKSGVVCGIDGVTYGSECEALSGELIEYCLKIETVKKMLKFLEFSMVDYAGQCQAVGLIDDETTAGSRCPSVKCDKKLPKNCLGIVPPGACCPICGEVLRIVYSRKQIDRALYALRGKSTESLTLKSILNSLQSLIKISQCYVSGYLTFETDIFVAVHSIHKNPTDVQIESCKREAEKLSILIRTKSHFITSDLGLSSLTVANIVQPIISASQRLEISVCSLIISIFMFVLINR